MVDFDFYNDACYHLGLDELEHADSLEYCLNLGGNLATITSPEEQVDIEDYLCEYIFFVRRRHHNMSLCTGSRVNTNCERVAPCAGFSNEPRPPQP